MKEVWKARKRKTGIRVDELMKFLYDTYGVTNEAVLLYTADGRPITDWRVVFGDPGHQSVCVFLGDPE